MVFNSYSFFLFFIIVIFASRAIRSWQGRKFLLLIASYLFYAAWNPPFVILIWISTVADWFIAKNIYQAEEPIRRKQYLTLSLLINLGMLGFFKYSGFLLDNFTFILNSLGIPYSSPEMNILLPVGISFYTFQTLSYTIDIYRKKIKPWHSFLDYALYVTFFPQLVAGPIVRAVEFLPQLVAPKKGTYKQVGWGLSVFVVGLFYKVVLADTLMAPVVEQVYESVLQPGFFQAWAGTLAFAVQIFCDFAGYSLCAIGVAMCFGFVLPDNFRFPYAAIGFSDFWQRWHISLSSWLRDYLYIPLGGNRKGNVRTYVNLMLKMLIGGLWHGASWLFVIWGGLHGLFLVGERLLRSQRVATYAIWQKWPIRILLGLITFGLVCFAWVFFRAGTLAKAFEMTLAMAGFYSFSLQSELWLSHFTIFLVIITTGLLFSFHWYMRDKSLEQAFGSMPWLVRSALLTILIFLIISSFSGEDRAFIYFQF
jgi:D-alanyl-lipoteichoic acid acyltransferase DltB (MBOAT superfamily)